MMKKRGRSSWLALVLLFMYLPVVILAVYSFTDTATIGTSGHFSLQNYKTLFTTGELLSMIGGTFALAFGSALIATILGTIGAIGAFYSKKGPRRFMDFANQIPVVNAEVVTGFSICVLLIVVLGLSKDSFFPLIVGHVVLEAPFVYLSVLPKLKQMDNSIYEAALDLGATKWQVFRDVILPQILPAILSGVLLAFAMSFDDVVISIFVTGPKVNTLPVKIYTKLKTGVTPEINALATVMLFVILLCLAGAYVLGRKSQTAVEKAAGGK